MHSADDKNIIIEKWTAVVVEGDLLFFFLSFFLVSVPYLSTDLGARFLK